MISQLLLAGLLLLSSGDVPADATGIPDAGFSAGWAKSGPELIFREQDLFGHIDGGADLFLEFGFVALRIQNYESDGGEIGLEVYEMESPEAALGIYLMKCGREQPLADEPLPVRHSWNRYQTTLLGGSRFVQVNSFTGKRDLVPDMIALARACARALPAEREADPFRSLPIRDLIPGSERIVRGPLGLESLLPFVSRDVLLLQGEHFAIAGRYRGPDAEVFTRVIVEYGFLADAREVFDLLHDWAPGVQVIEILEEHGNWFSFMDYRGRFGSVHLRSTELFLKADLPGRPRPTDDP